MKKIIWLVQFCTALFLAHSAWALNGAQLTGYSAVHEALGGSGVAHPQDFSAILINPAGITQLPRQASFNLLVGFPNSRMNTAASPLGNVAAGTASSNDDPLLLPGGGFIWPTPWLDNRITFGLAVSPVAGFSLDYTASRLGAVANTYDSHTFYGLLKVVPGVGFQINDQWSIGLTVHIDHAELETNSALFSGAQTAGASRRDGSFGIGFGIGVLYQPLDWLAAGLSYTSQQFMQNFERYTDLLPAGVDFPRQLQVGLSFQPLETLFLNTDFRWINWDNASGGFARPVEGGAGLGWQDQYIILFGLQYDPLEWLAVRLGYNYGRSAIPARSLFGSLLASPVGEHHLSGGLGFDLSSKLHLDFSFVHTFRKTVTDNGARTDALAGLTTGAFTRQSINQFSTEVTLDF